MEGNIDLQVADCDDCICLEAIFSSLVSPCIAAKLFLTESTRVVGNKRDSDEVDEELFFFNDVLFIMWLLFGLNNHISSKFG